MIGALNQLGRERALALFADWTDRIAAGEVPPAPPRPQGIERNVVITEWDWADPKAYLHDEVSTDRRNPTRQRQRADLRRARAERRLPARARSGAATRSARCQLTVRDPNTPPTLADDDAAVAVLGQRSRSGPARTTCTTRCSTRRAACGSRRRCGRRQSRLLQGGIEHPSAKLFPIAAAGRHLAMYDPKTKKLTHISTCFGTHHLMFAEDANNTLWTSGGGQVVGWLNTKMFDETGDEAKSQGWTALIIDTNGNGKRDAYVEPNQPVDPTKDKRFGGGFYAVAPAPDGSIWGSVLGFPGAVVRLDPGANPPETALAEVYEPPFDDPKRRSRLLAARHGRRSQRRRLGGARERTHGQLRSAQVQGPAQRAEGDRPALPGGLDALSGAAAAAQGRHRLGQRRRQLLHVGRSVRHARPRREHADRHRQRVRRVCSR